MPHRAIRNADDLDALFTLFGNMKPPVTVGWSHEEGTVWYSAPGYEGIYEITSGGRVRSVSRFVNSPAAGGKRLIRGRELRLQQIRGYWGFQTRLDNGRKRSVTVHRLIAKLFVPNPDGKPHVNHIDGNKQNNDPTNLEWVTHAENMHHAFETGLTPRPTSGPGERSPAAKLTWAKVGRIRALLGAGATQASVAQQFGITPGAVGFIARNETWRIE